ncbi:MAG: septal ring lytic transglycosylase RlpA family protein [Candidatus Omnitrophica bacterium]|nr:septal ring lytic transglycosylase RlpA family protein [Candidatus Omnitrophota bacterium]
MTRSWKGEGVVAVFLVLVGLFIYGQFPLGAKSFQKGFWHNPVGMASWYSEEDPGVRERTANNEVFNDQALTCAMWDVPFNQKIKVTNLDNGKSVVVRVNDRGPHKRLVRDGRIIDLSKAAFDRIAVLNKGLIHVQLEFL